MYAPDVDLADPSIDPVVMREFRNRDRAHQRLLAAGKAGNGGDRATGGGLGDGIAGNGPVGPDYGASAGPSPADDHLMSMIGSFGQLDLDEHGEWDFHGISSGALFLRRLREHFSGDLLGKYDQKAPFLPRVPRPPGMFNLDSPRASNASSPWDSGASTTTGGGVGPGGRKGSGGGAEGGVGATPTGGRAGRGRSAGTSSVDSTSTPAQPPPYELPPRDLVRKLCHLALSCGTCLMRIVHVPSFYEQLDHLYETPAENYGYEETRFLGLLFAVMALGCMYDSPDNDPDEDDDDEGVTYEAALNEG